MKATKKHKKAGATNISFCNKNDVRLVLILLIRLQNYPMIFALVFACAGMHAYICNL